MTFSYRATVLILPALPVVITVAGLLTAATAIVPLASGESGSNGGAYFQLVLGVALVVCGLAATIALGVRRRRAQQERDQLGG